MLAKHRLSPYIAVLIITLVGSAATLFLMRAIHTAEALAPAEYEYDPNLP